jgi:hypothetical protein
MKHTGQPLQKIEDVLERDYFMTAEMAKDFGLVDKVIDKRPEMPPLAGASPPSACAYFNRHRTRFGQRSGAGSSRWSRTLLTARSCASG